jgi:hypothetical protein
VINNRVVLKGVLRGESLLMWRTNSVKPSFTRFLLVFVGLWSLALPASAQVNVTQFHNHASRDGLYIDSAFTPSAAANLTRDLNFDGTISGNVYAQPLYIEDGPGGRAMVIAVTESNNVCALDAVDGSVIWERNVGPAVSADDLICTKFDPMGITGTPIVDLASRALFLDAMTTPDGGETIKHLIYIQRDQLQCIGPTATTGARHRGQNSLCWVWEYEGLQSLSWLARRSTDR